MNAEMQQAARAAWAAMIDTRGKLQRMVDQMAGENRGPMLPGIALDMVQEVTGERGDAISSLIQAGADWLDGQTRPSTAWVRDAVCIEQASQATAFLRAENLDQADDAVDVIEQECRWASHPVASGQEKHAAHQWGKWADKARSVIDRCRLIVLAAIPDAPAEAV